MLGYTVFPPNMGDIIYVIIDRLFWEEAISVYGTETPNVFEFSILNCPDDQALGIMSAKWFEFADETGQYSQGFYPTEAEAKVALNRYCTEVLGV